MKERPWKCKWSTVCWRKVLVLSSIVRKKHSKRHSRWVRHLDSQHVIMWEASDHLCTSFSFVSTFQVSKAAADLMAYCDAHIREDPLIMPVPASENPFREKKFFCTILWWPAARAARVQAWRCLASLSSPHLKLLAIWHWVEFLPGGHSVVGQLCPGGWRFWGSRLPNWQPSERVMSC